MGGGGQQSDENEHKEHKERTESRQGVEEKIIIIRVFFCLYNDDRKAEVDVTATVYLHWMVK